MAYIKLDDRFPDHPKVALAGPDAAWLYICGLCYCNRYLTDGFIPAEMVVRLTPFDEAKVKQLVSNLLAACLWVASTMSKQNGYIVHDYADYQSTKAQILTIREARKKAGQIGGKRRGVSEAKVKQNANSLLDKEEVRREEVIRKKEEENVPPLPLSERVSPLKGGAPPAKKRKPSLKLLEKPQDLLDLFSEEELIVAHKRFPAVDFDWEASKCVDHHNAKGGSGNWKNSWRIWLENKVEFELKKRNDDHQNLTGSLDPDKFIKGKYGHLVQR